MGVLRRFQAAATFAFRTVPLLTAVGLSACGLAGAPPATSTPPPTSTTVPTATLAPSATATTPPTATALPTSTATESPTAVPTPAISTFTDPWAYCSAAGTIDTPGPNYTGPKVPDAVAQGLKQASGAAADAPLAIFQNGGFWRCMNGQVYACFVGANLPCEAKANIDKTPTAEEIGFCQANPNSDVIPAVVTGHDTIYEWRCTNGTPEAVKQVFHVDERAFIREIWYKIPHP